MKIIHLGFHLVSYYIAWFVCILTAARGYVWLGPAVVGVLVLLQWWWQYRRGETEHLWRWVLLLTGLGFVVDSMLLWVGEIQFFANPWPFSPPWMLALWVNFSIVLYACLRDWFDRYWLMAVLALLGFPLAYWAGVALGAATLPGGYLSGVWIGVVWMILLPLAMRIYREIAP